MILEKQILLKDWEKICLQVKRGLQRLGHDIVISQIESENKRASVKNPKKEK